MPAAAASSTAYWISGLSTIGSISFGLALVTGRKRLPSPATGNTAFRSFTPMGSEVFQLCDELFFFENRDTERAGLVELGSGVFAGDHVIRFLRHRAGHLVPLRFDRRTRLVAAHPRESTSQDEGLGCAVVTSRGRFAFRPGHAGLEQRLDDAPVVLLVEELAHRARHHRADVGYLQEGFLARLQQGRQIAEMPGEIAGRAFADVADAERVDEALEGRLPRA